MSTLNRIVARGFKSIREMDLELRPLNILIGANGSGKSNFLSLFTLVNQMAQGKLQRLVGRWGANWLIYRGSKTTPSIHCELVFEQGGWAFDMRPAVRDSLNVSDEAWQFAEPRGPLVPDHAVGGYSAEARFPEEAGSQRGTVASDALRRLQQWRVYHFHDTSESAKVKQTCDIRDNEYLRPDGANLAAYLYFLREVHPDRYLNIVDAVRMVTPFFDDFTLRPHPFNHQKILLESRDRGWDEYIPPDILPGGTLRFMCLATLLLQPELPSLMLIDEPELGLHPSALALVAGFLRSASKSTQVIACTQSATMVSHFQPEDIVVVEREESASTFRRLSSEELEGWLEEYTLGELWQKNIFGGRP